MSGKMGILNENHWKVPGYYKQRVTTKELRQIFLHNEDSAIIQGRFMHLKNKHLGAGIYEVWFEKEAEKEKSLRR
jgi:hypothetical protein